MLQAHTADPAKVTDVVSFDAPRLGDLTGVGGVHLQCHLGTDGDLVLAFPWFERPEPTVWDEPGSSVDTDHAFTNTRGAEGNHGLGELVTAVLAAGLEVTGLEEHRSVPWQAVPHVVEAPGGEWALPGEDAGRVPLSSTFQARRP